MNRLTRLTLRLATGTALLNEDYREETAAYILSKQDSNGGFQGRRGIGELYYTGFAIRGLALLGKLTSDLPAIEFLKTLIREDLEGIEVVSLLMSAVITEMATGRDVFVEMNLSRTDWGEMQLKRFRLWDGGFASSPDILHSSTYHTFLMTACSQLLGIPITDENKIVHLILNRQREDGGFVELAPLRQSGTNPTAAAVSLLKTLGDSPFALEKTKNFLLKMQTETGGFRAHARVPVADLLSTFTAMVALNELGITLGDHERIERFVDALRMPNHGYIGGIWDSEPDIEYTFYGLAAKSLIMTQV